MGLSLTLMIALPYEPPLPLKIERRGDDGEKTTVETHPPKNER